MDIQVRPPGTLWWRGKTMRCALGRAGVRADKSEGDGATPTGCFPLRRVLYRADRAAPPRTDLPLAPINREDGWSDDPGDPGYNSLIRLPYAASHEVLWRDDGLYDILVVLGFNDDPPVPGRGSAIFLHVAAADYAPTEGCIALAPGDLRDVLGGCGTDSRLCVMAAQSPRGA